MRLQFIWINTDNRYSLGKYEYYQYKFVLKIKNKVRIKLFDYDSKKYKWQWVIIDKNSNIIRKDCDIYENHN